MAQALCSIAQLVGAPIAGALLDTGSAGNNYVALQLFSGLVMIVGGCQLIGLHVLIMRQGRASKSG